MNANKTREVFILSCILLFIFSVIVSHAGNSEDSSGKNTPMMNPEELYLVNNIHAQQGPRDCKASYANWIDPGSGHFIIPVNTPIKIGEFSRGFLIIVLDNDFPASRREVFFEYNMSRMGMTVNEYVDLITSPEKVSLSGFSKIDLKGIEEGTVYKGMTKNGVRTALGYPAKHRTPSLEEDTWVYWKNRFNTVEVDFDKNGKVVLIRD